MSSPQEKHAALSRMATVMNLNRSNLTNMVSSHYLQQSLSFATLERFLDQAVSLAGEKSRFNIGSMNGGLVVSIDLRPTIPEAPTKASKKRAYDDSADRANAAVSAARKRLTHDASITPEMLEAAEKQIERMFRDVRGTNKELVFESLGLSVTPTTLVTASASAASGSSGVSSKPKLIVACRLSAGIALPIYTLRGALATSGAFPDGMMTTNPESLGPEYRLPLSELGKHAETEGQRSILMFSAVTV